MEKLHHPLWIVELVNAVFGPLLAAALRPFGRAAAGAPVIPDYLVMSALVVLALTAVCLLVRSRLSVENPSRLQIVFEDGVAGLNGLLKDYIGPKGPRYLPIAASVFIFILCANLMGLVPGLMAPTSNINVPLGCAITVWVYYHIEGVRAQGLWHYLKHFATPPGAPLFTAPLMLPIEIISHLSRLLSLSLRLFGNIFGEELVIAILFSIIPFLVPIPMMFMGIITGTLQAFIFLLLTAIYLGGAVATEHDTQAHGEFAAGEV
ncbi:MAG TPA: F0F1 ATP synthase subunit A [Vicinamibacterales bacterium]|nr:F0F1 ATP synthase subunit A [Vicinamibacterales bacterium]